MKPSRRLLKQITLICLALITTLFIFLLGSSSIAQTKIKVINDVVNSSSNPEGTWLLPIPQSYQYPDPYPDL